MNIDLHIRLPKSLGCTVASTAVLKVLKETFPDKKLFAYTDFPDLVQDAPFIDVVLPSKDLPQQNTSIDLLNYLQEHDVLRAKPYRHLIDHMYEIAEDILRVDLARNHSPYFHLNDKEVQEARDIINKIYENKPVVWLQKKTSTSEKDWANESWQEFESANRDHYTFLELNERYNRRLAITLTKICAGGVTLDTFLSHGSQAVGAPNVTVILVSTRPEIGN